MKDQRLYHSVADQIRQMISDGSYPAGSRLPGERQLAEKFGVSRVTIREAEISLQALGLIRIRTGSGVYVLDSTSRSNGGFPEFSAFELTEARSLFESEGAALAARHMTDDIIDRLEEFKVRMGDDSLDDDEAEQADRDFHMTIAAASGNAVVRYIVDTLWKMRTEVAPVKKVYDSVCSEDATVRSDEHADILDALRDRDPVRARLAMRQHFTRLLESMLDTTEEQALEELRKQATESRRRYLNNAAI